MKNLKYLILLPCILFLACYNKGNLDISVVEYSGRVLSKETQLPIKGLNIRLKYLDRSFIDSVLTDDNGNFSLKFLNFDERDCKINIHPSTKYVEGGDFTTFTKDYYLTPVAYLKINTTNTPPFSKDDEISFNYFTLNIKGVDKKVSIIKIPYEDPQYLSTIGYRVFKNGTQSFFKKDIKLKSFDTLQVNINY